ncbi:PHD and RING finger domain-containing 1, partial [Brachionus plicatilis]
MKEIKSEFESKDFFDECLKHEIDLKQKFQNCPICLCNFKNNTTYSNPDVCEHIFCLDCLQEWSKKINTCPIDRKVFGFILIKNNRNQIIQKIKVEDRTQSHREEFEQELTFCEICRQPNREDRMLLCDACDKGYHCECLNPPIAEIPEGEWFCPQCITRRLNHTEPSSSHPNQRRLIARTNFAERVRRNVNENRRNLSQKTIKKKTIKKRKTLRKKTKRIRRKVSLKTSKKSSSSSSKSSKIVKKYKRTKKKSSTKRKKATLTFKKYYKSMDRKNSPKKRILKRILEQDDKKENNGTISNLSSMFRVKSLNEEDHASIQLTSQTSQYFESSENNNRQNLKEENKTSTSINLLNSIMNSQSILTKSSSNIKINHNGSIELIKQCSKHSIENKELVKRQKIEHTELLVTKKECTTFIEKKSLINSFDKKFNCKEEPVQPKIDSINRPEVKFNPKAEIFDFEKKSEIKKSKLPRENSGCKLEPNGILVVKQESTALSEKKSSIKSSKESSSFENIFNCKKEPAEPKIDSINRPEVKFNPKAEIFEFGKKIKLPREKSGCKFEPNGILVVKQECTTHIEKISSIKSSKESSSFENISNCKEEPTEPKMEALIRPKIKFNQKAEIFDFEKMSKLPRENSG